VKYKCMLLHLQFWCALRMTHLKEQCACIKFCFELGKNAMEILKCLKCLLQSRHWKVLKFLIGFPNSKVV